jgi:general secretion pathway protein J
MKRGFSLLEVLISAALMALVGMLLLTSLSSSLDAKEAVEATSGRYHLIRLAVSRLVDEISMAYVSAHRSAQEVKVETGFKGEAQRIDFTAFGYVPRVQDAKRSDQRELSYFIGDDPKSGRRALVRREDPTLDEDFEKGGRELVLLPGATALELAYWDKQTESWKDEWDFEDAASNGKLPERVRIKLTVEMDEGVEQTFVTQARIFLTAPLAFQQ